MGHHTSFSPSMKMAEIISSNYTLISVLPRFNIQLGFGEGTIHEICKSSNIDTSLFLMVCNVYTFPNFTPNIIGATFSIDALILYLQNSHNYYLSERICSIESHLSAISTTCQPKHKDILCKFFEEYKGEVIKHFEYEEQEVFPYIKKLTHGESSNSYHIDRFEQNHSNIEDKLSDLKNILIKYLQTTNAKPYLRSELLLDLFLFEEELNKHQLIEELILIPIVEHLEKDLE